LYHLHSILIHKGGAGVGHYYAFIKPTIQDSWYKFNDNKVSPVLTCKALSVGYGGPSTRFEYKDGRITECFFTNSSSAYMLVYVRDKERESIMQDSILD
jgi:ubiquitin carboxyl-terminal hydrolase 7